jgi:hypothetical protein
VEAAVTGRFDTPSLSFQAPSLSSDPLWAIETKSSSEDISPGSNYWRRLALDVQIGTYLRGARTKGYNVIGCLYDVLGVPQLRPKMATPVELRKYTKPTKKNPVSKLYANQYETDEAPEDFGARCLAEIVANPNKYYQRGEITRMEQEHRETASDTWGTALSMREAKRLNIYPRNPSNCVSWNRECEYLPLCCGEASAADTMLYQIVKPDHEELSESSTGLIRITQSSLRTYRGCPKKHHLRNNLGIRSTKKPETLRRGTSVHGGVEVLRKTGSLEQAIQGLDQRDLYKFEKEKAMLVGYYAYWGPPRGIVAVELEFEIPLINPETGAASRTFSLAGKMDALCLADRTLLEPSVLSESMGTTTSLLSTDPKIRLQEDDDDGEREAIENG